jgi:hypothetical protein
MIEDRMKPLLLAAACALALSACNRNDEGNGLAELGNDADPALTSALNDQILVDPELANQSNRNAVRPPATPTQAQYPQLAAGKAGAQPASASAAAGAVGTGCTDASKLEYNGAWAGRMPSTFPLLPGAKITDAAGTDRDGCRARAVTFTTAEQAQRVLDWYHTRAVRAGYSSEHQLRQGDHVLAGTNRQGAAFYLIVTPKPAGAEVALITNGAA